MGGAAAERPRGRARVLESLAGLGGAATVDELAARADLHRNTVRSHLERLVATGAVRRAVEPPRGAGRPRVRYALRETPEDRGDEYAVLAQLLAGLVADELERPAASAQAVGRAWGRRLGRAAVAGGSGDRDPVAGLVEQMRRLGFAPTLDPARLRVLLGRCPFVAVAQQQSPVVCGVHLGMMQGWLETRASDVVATRLDPFVEPSLCVAHLARVA